MSAFVRDFAVATGVAVVVAAAMEPWARVLHGRLWHGLLYRIHVTHHTTRLGRFEMNDALSGLHAPFAAGVMLAGCQLVPGLLGATLIGVGAGMSLFGLAYLVVHDGFVHERLPVSFLDKLRFFRRVRAAHRVHHERGGAPYGFFLGPSELKASRRAARRRGPSAPT